MAPKARRFRIETIDIAAAEEGKQSGVIGSEKFEGTLVQAKEKVRKMSQGKHGVDFQLLEYI